MNIVFVLSDTFRRDHLDCYGQPPWEWDIQTPHLSRLAKESIVFDQFYGGSFPTIPTVHDILTGQHCFQGTGIDFKNKPTLPRLLGKAGITSFLVTDAHNYVTPAHGIHHGFTGFEFIRGQQGDHYRTSPRNVNLPCHPDKVRQHEKLLVPHLRNTSGRVYEREWFAPRVFQTAIDWLETNHDQHDNFFLYIHSFDVHEPWDPPHYYVERYDPGYDGEEVILPRYDRCDYLTEAEMNHCRALYAGEIGLVDRWFGMLLGCIDHLGLRNNTVVIFTADHGFYLGDHGYIGKHAVLDRDKGWPLYNEITHCPLLMRIPDITHRRYTTLAQHVDLMPTICELAGLKPPDAIHGRSLLPILKDENNKVRDLAITSQFLPKKSGLRTYSNVTDGEYALVYAGAEAQPELYHLSSDPREEHNIIDAEPEIARALHNHYIKRLKEIGAHEEIVSLRRAWL